MIVIDQLGLRQDPFGPASSATGFGVAAPLRLARDRLMAAVRRGDPLTVLAGRPGMGKTLLLGMIEHACRADGIEVRAVARGDMAHTALGSGAQLLLIDEADTINAATLKALAPGTAEAAAPTMVFAAAQPALHRISGDVRTTIVDLRPLDPMEAREFLLARAVQAGRPDLFTPEALDIIVDAGRGSPRLLRVLAGAAMFQAVSDGVARITADHANLAAAMQGSLFGRSAAGASLPVPANDLGPRVDTEDRPRMLVPPLLRPLSRGRAGALAVAASVALTALVMPVFFLPEPTRVPSMGVPSANAASAVSGAVSGPVRAVASAFTVAPANAAVPILPLKASVRTEVALRAASAAAPPLMAARMPRIATTAIESRAPSIAPTVASLVVDAVPVTYAVRPDVETRGGRSLLIDLLAATRLRPAVVGSPSSDGSQGSATGERSGAMAQPAATLVAATVPAVDEPPPPVMLAALSPPPVAAPFSALAVPAAQSAEVKQAAEASRFAKAGADEAGAAKQIAAVAKQGAEETRTTKAAAQQAKESARQAEAAKEAADQAKAAKDAADQAAATKETAKQAKAAKEAADQAKSSKEAADQAKAVKAAAEQAKAAKESSEQAKAAKDAADQAKAAKDAADQAKAAKEAADQAKAAKDAADQAKAAKDAADQAKAAKDAADQAKAAKDAADQAKAARDAADQAKAAKDAASQAKAAKEAADAAKEAAKAAKEAAKAAKEAAKAGKGN